MSTSTDKAVSNRRTETLQETDGRHRPRDRAPLDRAPRRTRLSDHLRPDLAVWDSEPIADLLVGLLDGLPFNQRAVIVLRFYIGLSNVEIADGLDCPPGSVGPLLNRALEHLRKVMP